jgi:molybdopterin synthase catalytic subunit
MDRTKKNGKSIMASPKRHKVLTKGPVEPSFIAEAIARHSAKTAIGAHDIFLGQVRKDVIEGKPVAAIEYSAYEEMAEDIFHEIREAAFQKFELTCMHIHHSMGRVKAGELCLFVFVSSPHRQSAFEACRWIVEEIKHKVPVWGKELFEDETYEWKKNNF